MTRDEALLKAKELWGENAIVNEGKSISVYTAHDWKRGHYDIEDSEVVFLVGVRRTYVPARMVRSITTPMWFGRGKTWEEAFEKSVDSFQAKIYKLEKEK